MISLPSVFQVRDGKFVIVQDGASEAEIHRVVSRYLSGVLKIS